MEPQNKSKNTGIVIGVIVVVAIIAGVVFANKKQADTTATTDQSTSQTTDTSTPVDTSTTPTASVPSTTPAQTPTTASTSVYKDGTYTATGSYISPGGPDQVGVTLTLKDDLITDITVTPKPGDRESAQYQAKFVSGYKPLVIGKNISTVKLSRVSGSSLTSGGFNAALAKIETQAKA